MKITVADFLIGLGAKHSTEFEVKIIEQIGKGGSVKWSKEFDDESLFMINERVLDREVKDFKFFEQYIEIYC